MTEHRDDGADDLRAALRQLPAVTPGPAFTARVLSRLDRPASAPPRRVPPWLAAAASVAILAGALWGAAAGRQALQRQQRRAAMRAESAALGRELAALHEEVQRPAPVLYLGGNEQLDIVLDLSSLPIAAAAPAAAASAFGNGRR